MFAPRDVINIWDRWTRPEKPKIHICICPERRLFLRINSQPLFPPHHLLSQRNNPTILTHDSYVELNRLLRNGIHEINAARLRGAMIESECLGLVATVYGVDTLTADEKDLIARQIG